MSGVVREFRSPADLTRYNLHERARRGRGWPRGRSARCQLGRRRGLSWFLVRFSPSEDTDHQTHRSDNRPGAREGWGRAKLCAEGRVFRLHGANRLIEFRWRRIIYREFEVRPARDSLDFLRKIDGRAVERALDPDRVRTFPSWDHGERVPTRLAKQGLQTADHGSGARQQGHSKAVLHADDGRAVHHPRKAQKHAIQKADDRRFLQPPDLEFVRSYLYMCVSGGGRGAREERYRRAD